MVAAAQSPTSQRKRVFISYRHIEPDQTLAHRVAAALKTEHDVFFDQDLIGGEDWAEAIEDRLCDSDYVVALLSHDSVESDLAITEIETAHQLYREGKRPVIIPVRLNYPGPLPYPLSAYARRFQQLNWESDQHTLPLLASLLEAITNDRRPEVSSSRLRALWSSSKNSAERRMAQFRDQMIQRMRHDWIASVLETSLYHQCRIELDLVKKPNLLRQPVDRRVLRVHRSPQRLSRETRLSEVFDEQLGQLLLLGAPGSGKTTQLLELAKELLERAEVDEDHPIPVVFSLASWGKDRPPLHDWLEQELHRRYQVPKRVAALWLGNDSVLPLLDGLDEVAGSHRDACVDSINAFHQEHGFLPLVVSARTADYETLTRLLDLPGAVEIQPLAPADLSDYLQDLGEPGNELRIALESQPEWRNLMTSPLMVTVGLLAFSEAGSMSRGESATVFDMQERLYERYVDAMFTLRSGSGKYNPKRTLEWLARLARMMSRQQVTEFQLGNLQPAWLDGWVLRLFATLLPLLIVSAAAGVLSGDPLLGIVTFLSWGLARVLDARFEKWIAATMTGATISIAGVVLSGWSLSIWAAAAGIAIVSALGRRAPGDFLFGYGAGALIVLFRGLEGPLFRPTVDFSFWLGAFAAMSAFAHLARRRGSFRGSLLIFEITVLCVALFANDDRELAVTISFVPGLLLAALYWVTQGLENPSPADTFRFEWPSLQWSTVGIGAVLGLTLGSALYVLSDVMESLGDFGAALGGLPRGPGPLIAVPVMYGILGLLFGGLTGLLSAVPPVIPVRVTPNQALAQSVKMAGTILLVSIGVFLTVELFIAKSDWEIFAFGALLATGIALRMGGAFAMEHLLVRTLLWLSGGAPWRYARFLDGAAQQVFLQRVGGGYRFIHRTFQEYLARMA